MLENIKKLSMVLGAVMLMVSCSKDMEDVNPSATLSAVSTDAAKASSTNSFSLSELRTSDNGYTWSFDISRIGDKTGANANTVMLALYGCDNEMLMLSGSNVDAISVTKAGGTVQVLTPTYLETSAKACSMASTPGYVRFAEFDGNLKDGSIYTFTVKLKTPVQLTRGTIGVKAGNECIQSDVAAPGCVEEENLCGKGQGYFHLPGSWEGKLVTLGKYTYTEAEAIHWMNPNSKGSSSGNNYIKFAFSQAATVVLNRELGFISGTAFDAELRDIVTYLDGLGKLDNNKISMRYDNTIEGQAAKEAAGYIGDNIECDEE